MLGRGGDVTTACTVRSDVQHWRLRSFRTHPVLLLECSVTQYGHTMGMQSGLLVLFQPFCTFLKSRWLSRMVSSLVGCLLASGVKIIRPNTVLVFGIQCLNQE